MNSRNNKMIIWGMSNIAWLLVFTAVILASYVFQDGLIEMEKNWGKPEYSHGYLIPFITIFLLWQQKDRLERLSFKGAWSGVVLILLGIALYGIGRLSSVIDIVSYGFIVSIFGLALSITGWKVFKMIVIPLAVLLFMVPLPGFLYASISNDLQLISSKLGVAIIRLFGISVYLEGNVIDLGVYKLQVVEACSGLRYLFPLVTLGFIAAYFYKVEMWKRIVVFLSTIPITIVMNSIRIGMIGLAVEFWGIKMAEGLLHDFEGWAVFMACISILLIEMALLAKIGAAGNRRLVQVFGLELPEQAPTSLPHKARPVQPPVIASVLVLALAAATVSFIPEKEAYQPDRVYFSQFPERLGEWVGKQSRMESIIIDALNFDDYLMADYRNESKKSLINVYIGYYATQRADKVPHSPRACLPGGGWAVKELTNRKLSGVTISGVPLEVNRVIIEKGEYKQLVYYWFQQRDRVITNEWLTKWYLLVDSITKSRTDGALVRLITFVPPGEDIGAGDKRLTEFASQIAPILPEYIPD